MQPSSNTKTLMLPGTTTVTKESFKGFRKALKASPLSWWKILKLWHGTHDEGILAVAMQASEGSVKKEGFLETLANLFTSKTPRDPLLEPSPSSTAPELPLEAAPPLVDSTVVAVEESPVGTLVETLYAEKEMILCDIVSTVPREASYYSFLAGGKLTSAAYEHSAAYLPEAVNRWLLSGVTRINAEGEAIVVTNILGVASGVGMLGGLLVGGAVVYTCGPILLASLLANQGAQLAVAQTIATVAPALDPTGSWTGYLLMKSVGCVTGVVTSRYLRSAYGTAKASAEPSPEDDDDLEEEEAWED